MYLIKSIQLTLLISIIFISGCTHNLRVTPTEATEFWNDKFEDNKILNIKNDIVGIKKLKSEDLGARTIYNSFINSFESTYKGKIIKDYEDGDLRNVDKILELNLSLINYGYSHVKSLFSQFPGFVIGMPSWNGLYYSMEYEGEIKIYDVQTNSLLKHLKFIDSGNINYTGWGRGAANSWGWFFLLGIPPLIAGFIPSELDKESQDDALSSSAEYFGKALTGRVIRQLNSIQ